MFTYVVTSYRNPDQLVRLLTRLRAGSPDARLVVSHDRKSAPLDVGLLDALGADYRRTPTAITWGDGSYLRSVLAVFEDLALEPTEWVTLLTAQDYPLRPLRDYEARLRKGDVDTILEVGPDDDLLERYRRRGWVVPPWADRSLVARVVMKTPGVHWAPRPFGARPRVEVRRLRTPFGPQLRLHKGGDLFALNGKAMAALLAAPKSLLAYYDGCSIPSESYPHTVLLNAPGLRNDSKILHYCRWEASAHPEWLGVDDLADMLASGHYFARKFHQDDPVLDRLDDVLSLA